MKYDRADHPVGTVGRYSVPRPANFLLTRNGDEHVSTDVAEISDDELRAIGAAWTDALLRNASSRRTRYGPRASTLEQQP